MKTITQIDKEITDLKKEIQECDPKQEARLRKRLSWFKTVKMYLESNPSELFVREEAAKVEAMINRRMEMFIIPRDNYDYNKLKREHESFHGVPKLREQLKTLHYIL